jgi:cytochrome c-type biogenesis protein
MALTVGIAFIAGILSFFTPCVFTLVPAFLAYLAGINIKQLGGTGFNKTIFLNTLFYVLGFTIVFTALGIALNTATAVLSIQLRAWLTKAGALVIILFGLYMLGLVRVQWLEQDRKFTFKRKAGYLTSFLFGVTFAVGWTPCFGAVLGGIFTLAATQTGDATILLLAYSLGLALPFLVLGTFYSSLAKYVKLSARYTRVVGTVLGVLLVLVGLLLFFNRLVLFSAPPLFTKYL